MDNLQEAYLSVYESYLETDMKKREENNKKAIEDTKKTDAHKDMVATVRKKFDEEVETDLFNYLLEYLVAEGYADTNKNAIAIMANMSEEWKEEILDESRVDWKKGKLSGSGRSPQDTALDRAFTNYADAQTTRGKQAVRGPRGRQAERARKAYAAIQTTTQDYNAGKHS